jgi:hypothetical protein
MNRIKRISLPICLVLLGIGMVLLAGWDMQNAAAASRPEAWFQGAGLPLPDAFYGPVQCPDDPDSFYVIAGWQGWFVNRDEVWRYDADTDIWTQLASYPEKMGIPSVTCYQGYLYAAGGSPDTPGTSAHFYRYEIATNTWTQLSDLPRTQNGAALAAWDGYLYMIGGDDAPAIPISPTTQVDRYNLRAGTWETDWGTPMPVTTIADWLQAGQYVYFVGGFTSAFPINSDATLRYDLTTDTWEIGPSFASRRAMMALTITSQYLYAIGGDANGGGSADETDLVERLDLSAWPFGSWEDISDPLTAPRAANAGFCSEAVTGGEIWSVGGLDLADNPTTEIFYRPSEPCFDWPPQVLGLNPAPNSHDAEVTTPISITYDMDIDPGTVDAGSFAVHARQTGWLTETLSVDGGMIMLQPTAALHAGELVQVTATTATLSLDGEAPAEPTVWEFTTAPWGGNGRLTEHQILPNADGRYAALGDLNGDGSLDAITVSCHGMTRIYQNDSSGTFTEVQSFDHATYCLTAVKLGDLDGDGDLDAFLANYDPPGPSYFLINDGAGHFSISVQTLPSEHSGYSEFGDLDGDGDLDICIASGGFFAGALQVWKNDGAGNFTLASDFGTAFERTGIALGDLDNDGDLDAFTAGWYNTYNEVWLNDGAGNFSQAQSIPNANTYYPLLGDLNGDGYLDVYLSNTTDVAIYPDEVWLNDGTGHFTDSGQRLDTVPSLIPALGDLDADGDLDVYLSGSFTEPASDEVWANDGSGNFSLFHTMDEDYPGGIVTLGDLDSDGALDAFVTSQFISYGYQVYLNSGWKQAEPIPHSLALSAHVQCADDPNSLYILGGADDIASPTDYTFRYNVDVGSWQQLAPMLMPAYGLTGACVEGKIYVQVWTNRWMIYDIAFDSWSFGANLPRITEGAALGAWDGKLYLVGGTEGANYQATPSVDIYDIVSNTWTSGTPMPEATDYAGVVQTGPYLYILGGMNVSPQQANLLQRYNMADDTWQVAPYPSGMTFPALTATGEYIYALGGDPPGDEFWTSSDLVERLALKNWLDGEWEDIQDPLPEPSLGASSFCTNGLTDGEIWHIGGGDLVDMVVYTDTLYHHAEPCVSIGVDLPEPWGDYREAGTTAEYLITITNTGVVTDYFTLDVSTTWNIESPVGGPGPIGPGESMQIAIAVDIPASAPRGTQGVTEITATSISNPVEMDTTVITTTVGEYHFDVQPIPPDSQEDHPGNVLTYTLMVSNSGDFEDSYNVEISATWETTASLTVGPLLPGEDGELVVLVTIPQDANHGDWDSAVITFTSQSKPEVIHQATLNSTAVWHRMLLPLALKN